VESYDPTIEDYYRRQAVIDGEATIVSILDTAGQEEYSAMRPQYMRQGHAFVMAYSITDRTTFDEVKVLREQVLRVKDADKVPMILVATKKDLETQRKVSTEEGQQLAEEWGVPFLETSARTRENIEEAFFSAVREARLQDPNRVHKKDVTKKAKKPSIIARSKQLAMCTIC
jgi:GTPase KRas protein